MDENAWRRCSACKKPIPHGAIYWVCSVSTCNQKRTALAFCTVSCWEVHLPGANHREAWAVERTAPAAGAGEGGSSRAAPAADRKPRRLFVGGGAPSAASARDESEVLVVSSRLKEYIRAQSGFNTSDRVLQPLSDLLRRICDEAIRNARREGRMTVLDRDIPNG